MIPKYQIEIAKSADLPKVLQSMGIELVANGNGFHMLEHDSLKLFRQDGIWLYKWWSRGGEVGDGIQYLQRHCGMSFAEAVASLSQTVISQKATVHHLTRQDSLGLKSENESEKWTSKHWQRNSEKLIQQGQSSLLGPNGKEGISYLIHKRGLHLDTIRKYRLGWLPAKGQMPSKLLIPCYNSQGDLIRIRFRIDTPGPGRERYRIRKGSNPNLPYPIGVSYAKPVMILESELDTILMAQETGAHVGVLGLGTTGAKLNPAMIRYLNDKIPFILISLDNDQSGRKKTAALISELPGAIDWPVPEECGNDPGEAWMRINLKAWVETGLKNRLSQNRRFFLNPGTKGGGK
jgi:hypothetical protein